MRLKDLALAFLQCKEQQPVAALASHVPHAHTCHLHRASAKAAVVKVLEYAAHACSIWC